MAIYHSISLGDAGEISEEYLEDICKLINYIKKKLLFLGIYVDISGLECDYQIANNGAIQLGWDVKEYNLAPCIATSLGTIKFDVDSEVGYKNHFSRRMKYCSSELRKKFLEELISDYGLDIKNSYNLINNDLSVNYLSKIYEMDCDEYKKMREQTGGGFSSSIKKVPWREEKFPQYINSGYYPRIDKDAALKLYREKIAPNCESRIHTQNGKTR